VGRLAPPDLAGVRAQLAVLDAECRIVTTASLAGVLTVEHSPAYVASKFAALSLTEDFRRRSAVVTDSIPLGIPVADAVSTIVEELERGTFYIRTHPQFNPAITRRTEAIVAGCRPSFVLR
jgi:hypothetical protein